MLMEYHEISRTNMLLQKLKQRHSAMSQNAIVGNDRTLSLPVVFTSFWLLSE